jgi:hypothetical protein
MTFDESVFEIHTDHEQIWPLRIEARETRERYLIVYMYRNNQNMTAIFAVRLNVDDNFLSCE